MWTMFLIGFGIIAIGWIAYGIWEYKIRQEEKMIPPDQKGGTRVKSERLREAEKTFEEYIFVARAVAEPLFTWFDKLCGRLPWNRDYENSVRERVKKEVPRTDVWVLCQDGLYNEVYRPLAEKIAGQIRKSSGRGIDKYPPAPFRL